MKRNHPTSLLLQPACFGLWPVLALGQQADLTGHQRNVPDCSNGWDSCDRSTLTGPEANALAIADHERNVANCKDALGSCDHSKLTDLEARDVALAEHQRAAFQIAGRGSGRAAT